MYNCVPEYLFQINDTVITQSSQKNYNSNVFQKNTLKSLLNSKIKLIQNIFPKKRIRSFLVAKTYQILLKKSYNGEI